jgi:hypothetical protein
MVKNNQAVLLPAWQSLFRIRWCSGILRIAPIPNWAVKYSGLMRYDLFKETLNVSLCNIIAGFLYH